MEDIDRYIEDRILESYEEVCEGMGIGDCIDENGETVEPSMWYWRGCSPQMNDPDMEEESYTKMLEKRYSKKKDVS